jgi:hypothetical protein
MFKTNTTSSIDTGTVLPIFANIGSLFYLTEGARGLYIYAFRQDGNAALGDQVTQGWQVISLDQGGDGLYLKLTGGVINGDLTVNGIVDANSTKLKLKRTDIKDKVPSFNEMEEGEIIINTTDGKLYFRNKTSVLQMTGLDASSAISSDYATHLKYN